MIQYQGGPMQATAAQKPKTGVDGKAAPMVFPTGGDLQTGNPSYNGAPQQGQGTPAPTAPKPAAPQQPPTFRTLQMAGIARPAPPPPGTAQPMAVTGGQAPPPTSAPAPVQTPQFQGGANAGALSALLSQMMSQPTAYDDATIQAQRTAGMGRLDQDSAMQKARLDEEMAGRGLFSSTIAQGRLGDININRQNAIADMESRFLADRARATDEGRRAAAGLGLQAEQSAFDQWLGQQNLGMDERRLGMDDAFRRDELGFRREDSQLDRAQRSSEFDREFGLDTARFGEDTRRWGEEFGEDRRQFDADLGYKDRALTEDTRRFDQEFGLDRDRFAFDKDSEDWDRNIDYYDLFSQSDLLDPTVQAPAAIPPRPTVRNAWDTQGIRDLQEWVRRYGGGR